MSVVQKRRTYKHTKSQKTLTKQTHKINRNTHTHTHAGGHFDVIIIFGGGIIPV
jgi:hypothetical protein